MSHKVLRALSSDDFRLAYRLISNPQAIGRLLAKSEEVQNIREALRSGEITEETIRAYVSELMSDYSAGELFDGDLALAALAVAMHSRKSSFAEEYLLDLSRLHLAEMPVSIRVARQSLKKFTALTDNRSKTFGFEMPNSDFHVWSEAPRFRTTETHAESCEYEVA